MKKFQNKAKVAEHNRLHPSRPEIAEDDEEPPKKVPKSAVDNDNDDDDVVDGEGEDSYSDEDELAHHPTVKPHVNDHIPHPLKLDNHRSRTDPEDVTGDEDDLPSNVDSDYSADSDNEVVPETDET